MAALQASSSNITLSDPAPELRFKLRDDRAGVDQLARMLGAVAGACTLREAHAGLMALVIGTMVLRILALVRFQVRLAKTALRLNPRLNPEPRTLSAPKRTPRRAIHPKPYTLNP